MEIRLSSTGAVTLEEVEDFRRFAVMVPPGIVPDETALAALMQIEGGTHAWVPPASVFALHPAADAAWRDRFDAMAAYAAGKGWTDAEGRIRAHIEAK